MLDAKIDISLNFNNLEKLINVDSNIEAVIDMICEYDKEPINFYWLGKCSYDPIWILQKKIHQLRLENKINDTVLLLEHEHVYTLGKNADRNHILPSKPDNAQVVEIDRGGDVTYHGPGQLVGYPIIDLHNYKMSITWYINLLSKTIINLLSELGIESYYKDNYIGVWVENEKIAAFGVRLARWITMHGFALNINTDLNYFQGMIPCGIFEYGVTSTKQITNRKLNIKKIAKIYSKYFLECLDKEFK